MEVRRARPHARREPAVTMRASEPLRLALVLNPRTLVGARATLFRRVRSALGDGARVVDSFETRGDATDVPGVAALLDANPPDVVVAAGGDGTVGRVVEGLHASTGARPALGIVPLGTGDNAARALGLLSLRRSGRRGLERAVGAILAGGRRRVDLGIVNRRPFLSAFGIGMDTGVLALRNRLRRRLGGSADGYALYLASFAMRLPARETPPRGRLAVDGAAPSETHALYNLCVLNTAIYAGVFRFEGGDGASDGLLDLHRVERAGQYLTELPRAWGRHLGRLAGARVGASPRLRRVRALRIQLEAPVPGHLDGEELAPAARFDVGVLPGALRVCVPPGDPASEPRPGAPTRP